MKIRLAENKDVAKICDLLLQINLLHHEGRPDIFNRAVKKFGEEDIKALILDKSRTILVAVDEDDCVMGYAFCQIRESDGSGIFAAVKTLWVEDLCVDEKARGQGIGGELHKAVERVAVENNCHSITLNVWDFNDCAKNFYTAHGMKPQRTIMEKML